MAKRKYTLEYGLIDRHLAMAAPLYEELLGTEEFEASSIAAAQKESNRLVKENDEMLRRFAYESPRWTEIYTIMKDTDEGVLEGMTRRFNRDVRDTRKVAYMHLTWYNKYA